jgi:flagellar biosynthetic protein FlhB
MAGHDQKTEQPTQRKLDRARKEGRFPSSREFISAVQFSVVLIYLSWAAESWIEAARRLMRVFLADSFRLSSGNLPLVPLIASCLQPLVGPLALAAAVVAASMLAAQFASTRLGFAWNRLAPEWNRMNPLEKLRRLPQQNFQQFMQAVFLLPVFMILVYWICEEHAAGFLRLPGLAVAPAARLVAGTIEGLLWRAAAVFFVVGVIDLVRQRRRWNAEMRMSKQEIRDEMKEVEGSPLIKGRIRRLMREMSRRRMMKDVETATTVIVNPTHFAVAVRYAPAGMAAPKVVAKGKNFLARIIRDRAIRHQVPVVENPPLARSLYQSTEVGQEIPAHLYRAVAEVLAYIFRLTGGRLR